MRKFTYAPWWAEVIYRAVEWLGNRISRISFWLIYWRIEFLDKHCQCEKCQVRRAEAFQREYGGRRYWAKPTKGGR